MDKPKYGEHETYLLTLHIDNDQSLYQECLEIVEGAYLESDVGTRKGVVSMVLKDWVWDMNPLLGQSNMWVDLLGAALSTIDWFEVAGHYIAIYEEQQEANHDSQEV